MGQYLPPMTGSRAGVPQGLRGSGTGLVRPAGAGHVLVSASRTAGRPSAPRCARRGLGGGLHGPVSTPVACDQACDGDGAAGILVMAGSAERREWRASPSRVTVCPGPAGTSLALLS